jgi:UDP-glucuronate 4-epimerase
MKLLVTGVAGFIGSQLTARLVARGDTVVGIDNFDPFYDRATKERNLASLRGAIEFVEGDITDRALLDRVLGRGGFDRVVHLAALAGVRPSIRTPWRYSHVNVVGTAHVAEAMLAHGVRRLVFASSSSVYGNNTLVPYEESQRVDDPASPYAVTKRAGELMLDTFHQIHGLSSACLRFFTVYGPRQRPEMAIHKFARAIEAGEPITVYGDGRSSRDYTYIDDILDGTLGAIDRAPEGCRIYNLGGTSPVRLDELVRAIGNALGKEPLVVREPHQPGDVLHTWADVTRARDELGYDPKVPLAEGLRRFSAWMRGETAW